MLKLIEDLAPLRRVICSDDYDRTVEYFCKELPFEVIRCTNADDHNGWQIPPKWKAIKATISRDGKVIYDGTAHPLGVVALSAPFMGTVDLDELKQHIHYDHRYPDELTFYYRQQFRPWDRDWGFSAPKTFVDSLEPGHYTVDIQTQESDGYLDLLYYRIEGAQPNTIVFVANSDHPWVANDGLSGCAVGIELMKRLQSRQTKFSYSLALAHNIIGTEYLLAALPSGQKRHIDEAVCLWMLGTNTQLALQNSRYNKGRMEDLISASLKSSSVDYRRDDFERVIINDEYIVESHGIPTCSLSRYPYPEYHSSADNSGLMNGAMLDEAVAIIANAVNLFEAEDYYKKTFSGAVCLSNPQFDLYLSPGQVALGESIKTSEKQLRYLMDLIPSFHEFTPMSKIQSQIKLPEHIIRDYLDAWIAKGLIEKL